MGDIDKYCRQDASITADIYVGVKDMSGAKTKYYLAVFEDGTWHHGVWGSSVADYRRHLERRGYRPTMVLQWTRPLWYAEGSELQHLEDFRDE